MWSLGRRHGRGISSAFTQIGTDVTFAHKDVAIRFSRESRAYCSMSHVIGGSPYWLLVQLVLGHNEALLWDLHYDLERQHGPGGMTGMMNALLRLRSRFHSIRDAEQRMRRTLSRRIRLAHYIPNLFRYTTEQQLYHLFASARGLEAQHDYFRSLEDTLETTVREIAVVNKERADARITRMLVAIGLVQVGGAMAAIATIDSKEFLFFVQHFDVADTRKFLAELSPGRSVDEIFRAVWALMPALLIMSAGFLMMGLISLAWMTFWLLARISRR